MGVNRIGLRHGYQFRHFGKQYHTKKIGLHFLHHSWNRPDSIYMPDKDVIELRDWLSRYINSQILKTTPASIPKMRASARHIIKELEKLESEGK